jgi:hypothetical protein
MVAPPILADSADTAIVVGSVVALAVAISFRFIRR